MVVTQHIIIKDKRIKVNKDKCITIAYLYQIKPSSLLKVSKIFQIEGQTESEYVKKIPSARYGGTCLKVTTWKVEAGESGMQAQL